MRDRSTIAATTLGFLAIVFWGSAIAFSRSLAEEVGTFTSASLMYAIGGALGCIRLAMDPDERRSLRRMPAAYWLVCGGLFVVYLVALYAAIGLSADRQQVVEVGLLNYLWPALTLTLSVPLLNKRARWSLWPGMLLAVAGAVIAASPGGVTFTGFAARLAANPGAYAFGLTAGVTWALYNNFAKRLGGGAAGNGTPLFLLASGAALALILLVVPETPRWSLRAVLELAYAAIFISVLGYVFWEIAMRRGNLVLVVSASYLIPLLSTAISCLYLGVAPTPALAAGAVMTMAGAVICSKSVVEPAPPQLSYISDK